MNIQYPLPGCKSYPSIVFFTSVMAPSSTVQMLNRSGNSPVKPFPTRFQPRLKTATEANMESPRRHPASQSSMFSSYSMDTSITCSLSEYGMSTEKSITTLPSSCYFLDFLHHFFCQFTWLDIPNDFYETTTR